MDCDSIKIIEPTAATGSGSGSEMVGIALREMIPFEPFTERDLFYATRMFEDELTGREINFSGGAGMYRPQYVLLMWEVDLHYRNPALRALVEIARDNVFVCGVAEVAYFDLAEGYWRTIHPQGAEAFARFMDPAEIEAAREIRSMRTAFADKVLEKWTRRNEGGAKT